jgi:hypothetical protein
MATSGHERHEQRHEQRHENGMSKDEQSEQ